jgi:hypothetical protein
MNFDVLHNFISPVTGRVLSTTDYVLVGDREGVATPSPILIDMRLELVDLRKELDEITPFPSDLGYVITSPDERTPNAQALSILNNGFMYNTGGIISTTDVTPLPSLTYKHVWLGDINNVPQATQALGIDNLPNIDNKKIWIGDSNNRPTATATISIDNLPSLGLTSVPNPTGGIVGKVWEGTSSGRPKESSLLGETVSDLAIVNAKLLAGKFIMKSGLVASFPAAQFLNALTAGALVKTSSAGDGKLESIPLTQNQVLIGGANNAPESRAKIGIDNLPTLTQNNLWLGDANSNPIAKSTRHLSNLPALSNNKIWKGDAQGRPAEVNLNSVDNLPDLENKKLWIGAANNRPVANSTIFIDNLPGLTQNKIWKGDAQGRPVETDFSAAPDDATYILKEPNANLSNAQVLSELGTGMAKIVAGGAFAIAIPDEDYATVETLNQIKAECEEFKNQAATSAEEASTSATEASASATEASASATEASAAAVEASAAAVEASAAATEASASATAAAVSAVAAAASALAAAGSASSASNSSSKAQGSANNAADSAEEAEDYLNQLLTTGITITGDVVGSGVLNEPITLTFKENPVFTGNGSMTIPAGTTAERPADPVIGMTRINTNF